MFIICHLQDCGCPFLIASLLEKEREKTRDVFKNSQTETVKKWIVWTYWKLNDPY